MKQFGAFEAKTHFSEILNKVIQGEKCVITKHGVQVAMIVPYEKQEEDPTSDAVRAIKKLRKGITLGKNRGKKLSIRKMREEGRR